jgi:type I restriction enzyme, S subunit
MSSPRKADRNPDADVKVKWQSAAFEQCVDEIRYTNKIPRSAFLQEGAYPVVSQEDGLINGYWNERSDVFTVSRPLTVFGDHTRVLKYIDFDFVLGADGVKILRPKGFLNPKFFHYQMQSFSFPSLGYARHYRLLKNKEVVFPRMEVQERIVATLDEAFEGIAKARSNTEKNLQKSIAVFNSQLMSIFSHSRIHVALSELATDISDGDHAPPPKASSGIPFITISNIVKETRTIDFRDTFSVPKEYFNKLKPHRKPRKGDILYTVTGATLGIPVYVDHETEFCFQRHIGLIRPRRNVDSLWLSYAMLSPQVFKQATDGATGAAQKTVSLRILRNVRVPRLSLTEQQDISQQLANLEKQAHRLAAVYSRKLVALEELKQSLLLQAFSGNL